MFGTLERTITKAIITAVVIWVLREVLMGRGTQLGVSVYGASRGIGLGAYNLGTGIGGGIAGLMQGFASGIKALSGAVKALMEWTHFEPIQIQREYAGNWGEIARKYREYAEKEAGLTPEEIQAMMFRKSAGGF